MIKRLQTIEEYDSLITLVMTSEKGFIALRDKKDIPSDSLEIMNLN